MTCEYCALIAGQGKGKILYEDDEVVIAIRDNVATPGQISVFTKAHYPILEMVPDNVLEKCGVLSNKVSVAVFESLGAQGTNIIVQNGLGAGQKVPHFAIEVIPRQESDGLNFQWEPKQLMEDEMESTFLALKEGIEKGMGTIKEDKTEVKENKTKKAEGGKENYLLKSIKRIP